jgi:hypothetical protein
VTKLVDNGGGGTNFAFACLDFRFDYLLHMQMSVTAELSETTKLTEFVMLLDSWKKCILSSNLFLPNIRTIVLT